MVRNECLTPAFSFAAVHELYRSATDFQVFVWQLFPGQPSLPAPERSSVRAGLTLEFI